MTARASRPSANQPNTSAVNIKPQLWRVPAPLPQPLRLLRGEPTVPLLSQTHTVNIDVNIESRSSLPVHHLVITSLEVCLAHEGNVPQ
jgi:hypothetical protein